MRDSYFASDVSAIVGALEERISQGDSSVNDVLLTIQEQLIGLLGDSQSQEREWRQSVSEPLRALAKVMKVIGKPTPSVEHLADELAA